LPFTLANVRGRACLVSEDGYYDLERISNGSLTPDPMTAVSRHEELGSIVLSGKPDGPIDHAVLGPPLPRPRQVFAIGFNYGSHSTETGFDNPEQPLVFPKWVSCIAGPSGDIVVHSPEIDFEGELVVAIGTSCKGVPAGHALEHVAGFMVGQDFSDRVTQFAAKPAQFGLGKSYPGFGPIGPVLVSIDSFEDPNDLVLTTEVNGVTRQNARTSAMLYSVGQLIEYLSAILPLYPGDLIFTGTPEGVCFPNGPYLQPGDVVTTTIEGIGTLTNRCIEPID